MSEVRVKLAQYDLFDGAILRHGFTSYMRDYELVAEIMGDPGRGVEAGTYRFRFTHCPEAHVITLIRDASWLESWDDINLDLEQWEGSDHPRGFAWGVCWAGAYPGVRYDEQSALAAQWTQRLGHPMHEIRIETNVYQLQILFHDIVVEKLGEEAGILQHFAIRIESK